MNNNISMLRNIESLERLRKIDKRLKLALAAVFFIVSAATAMVIIASLNSM